MSETGLVRNAITAQREVLLTQQQTKANHSLNVCRFFAHHSLTAPEERRSALKSLNWHSTQHELQRENKPLSNQRTACTRNSVQHKPHRTPNLTRGMCCVTTVLRIIEPHRSTTFNPIWILKISQSKESVRVPDFRNTKAEGIACGPPNIWSRLGGPQIRKIAWWTLYLRYQYWTDQPVHRIRAAQVHRRDRLPSAA